MSEPVFLIVVSLGLTLIFVVLPVVATWSVRSLTRRQTRVFRCPVLGRDVTAEFEEAAWDGERREVVRCSAFPPDAGGIWCEKACLGVKPLPGEVGAAWRGATLL